jgi:enediyne biosynthesis protein E4
MGLKVASILLLALLPTAARPSEPAVPLFAEETAAAGFEHSFTGGWEFMVGGGTAVFDCSGDRMPEIFAAGGTAPAALFRNDSAAGGALTFARVESGLEIEGVVGAYPIDIDGDGITDLAVLRVGPDRLMRGLGDCRFEDASADWGFDGLDLWSTAFAATWEDGAAWPTLAVGTYVDRTQEAFPWGNCTPNQIYRPAEGGEGFGAPAPLLPSYCTLSMMFTDWNRQGWPDLRVSNDREYYKGGQEQLWRLEAGQEPRAYTEADGWQRLRIWGMGIAHEDLDGDSYPEFFLTSMADNKLQKLVEIPAEGSPLPKYADIALKSGVTAHRPYTGGDPRPSTAWHSQFGDVNNDGRSDLFVVKGNVWEMPDFAEADPNNLLLQTAEGTFAEAGDRAGVASLLQGRGGALADLNADGRLDMVVINRNAPAQLWRNADGEVGNWVQVALEMDGANRDGIGSWIELRDPAGGIRHREVVIGGGHAGGVLGWQHFGLGEATETEVRVLWPDGTESPWHRLSANGFWTIGAGREPVEGPDR